MKKMLKIKLALLGAFLLLGTSGVAFAATGGLPDIPGAIAVVTHSQDSAADEQYAPADDPSGDVNDEAGNAAGDQYGGDGDHGSDVSDVARDRDATGTMTLPNGREVENHGMAVRDAAHEQGMNTDNENDGGVMAPSGQMPGSGPDAEDMPGPNTSNDNEETSHGETMTTHQSETTAHSATGSGAGMGGHR